MKESELAEEKKTVTLTVENGPLRAVSLYWKLISDFGKRPTGTFVLELVPFLRDGESNISGDKMIKRAKKLGADLGQHYAEPLLANQHLIPKGWREFCLVFPGTVWQDSGGDHRVPCLYWGGERWILSFGWLDDGWVVRDRFLRLRKPSGSEGK